MASDELKTLYLKEWTVTLTEKLALNYFQTTIYSFYYTSLLTSFLYTMYNTLHEQELQVHSPHCAVQVTHACPPYSLRETELSVEGASELASALCVNHSLKELE